MRRIDGDAKSVRGMLSGSKFAIDYYQREYRWESKQVAELLDDPHAEIKKTSLDARQELYREIGEQIWSPDVLRRKVEA